MMNVFYPIVLSGRRFFPKACRCFEDFFNRNFFNNLVFFETRFLKEIPILHYLPIPGHPEQGEGAGGRLFPQSFPSMCPFFDEPFKYALSERSNKKFTLKSIHD